MQGETVISEPLMSMDIHDKAMVVSTPLLNAAGKPAGVLYAILPCRDVVASTIEGVRIGKTGYAYIVDNGGLMLAHPDAKLIQEFDAKKVEWGRQVLASPQGTLRYTTDTGVDRLLNFRLDPESGWIAVTCLDFSEINETTAHIRNAALGIMLAGAAIVGLIIFLVTRPIIRDLLQCVACAKAIAEGDLDKQLTITRNDELGTLFDACAAWCPPQGDDRRRPPGVGKGQGAFPQGRGSHAAGRTGRQGSPGQDPGHAGGRRQAGTGGQRGFLRLHPVVRPDRAVRPGRGRVRHPPLRGGHGHE